MKKKWWVSLAIVILIIAVVYYFWYQRKPSEPIKTVTVTQGSISDKAIAIGQILPERSIKVKSQVSGIVAKLLHREGDYITEGDILLQIQPTPSPAKYDELTRDVEIKRVAEQARRANLIIVQNAYAQKVIDALKYGEAKENYKTAVLERQKAEEQLALIEQGKVAIGEHQITSAITSPITGHILEQGVNEGDPIVAQSEMQAGDVLFSIADMQHLVFRGEVNELDAVKLKQDMPATLTIGALPDMSIKGKVVKIALQSEQASDITTAHSQQANKTNTSKFNVGFKIEIGELQIPANATLKSGYSATAEIVVNQIKNALLLPERVLVFKEDKPYVQLFSAETEPKLQAIKTGISDGINVEVLEGLQLGQTVLDKPLDNQALD